MIVLDSAAILEFLLGRPAGRWVQVQLARPRETCAAPHIVDHEVVEALRFYERNGRLDGEEARGLIGEYGDLNLLRHPCTQLLDRAWELRSHVSLADGLYVALAEALDAPLLTCDRHLAKSRGHHAAIKLLGPV